jgi:hypothetical protein
MEAIAGVVHGVRAPALLRHAFCSSAVLSLVVTALLVVLSVDGLDVERSVEDDHEQTRTTVGEGMMVDRADPEVRMTEVLNEVEPPR